METKYAKFHAPGLSGVTMQTGSDCVFDPVSLLCLPDDPACCCKQGNSVQAGVNGTWFVKRYSHRTFWHSFRHLFKISRPEHCLKAAQKLTAAGIDTPFPAAALRQFRGKLPVFDYLITQDISEKAVFANQMPITIQLGRDLCRLLVQMHEAGIEHGDVNLRNLYQKHDGTWGVIDLDGSRLYSRPLPISRRRRELARLASGFIKVAARRNEQDALPADTAAFFAEEYKKLSAVDLNCFSYRNRVKYLAGRKRK